MQEAELIFNPSHLYPEAFLFSAAIVLTIVAVLFPKVSSKLIGYLSMTAFVVTGVLVGTTAIGSAYGDLFINDISAPFFKLVFVFAGFCSVGIWTFESNSNLNRNLFELPLFQLSVLAMMFLSMTGNLISLFASLELCALPLAAIVVLRSSGQERLKAAQKYVIVMLASSLLILFGFSFLFGLSGATNLLQMKLQIAIVHLTRREIGIIIMLSVIAILSGLLFKSALPPFHKWFKKIHQTLSHSFISFVVVAFTFAVLVAFAKIFVNGLFAFYGPEMNPNDWGRIVSFVAFSSMIFGTAQLFRQKNLRDLIFYFNFIHIGFILTGMVSMNETGLQSALFYVVAYSVASFGIYTVSAIIESEGKQIQVQELRGLFSNSKLLSILFGLFLMSLAGLPLTAGFVAKFSVIESSFAMGMVDKLYHWMLILTGAAVICTAIAFLKYGKIVYLLFAKPAEAVKSLSIPTPLMIVLLLSAVVTIAFGIFPDPLLEYASKIPMAFGFTVE